MPWKRFLLVFIFALPLALFAEDKVVASGRDIRRDAKSRQKGWITLVYNGAESPVGVKLREGLESAAFRNATSVRYLLGFVNLATVEAQDKCATLGLQRENAYAQGGALETTRTPAIFVGDKDGELFLIWENVSGDLSLQTILKRIDTAHTRQKELKSNLLARVFSRSDLDSAEKCGEFLAAMVPYLGSEARVLDEKAYARIWERLRKIDARDKTGWQRRFTLGTGEDLVKQCTAFALKKEVSEGAAFIGAERAKPTEHLSHEQQQALDMAEFMLYRADETKKEEAVKLLQKVCALDSRTPWGVAAMAWLESYEKPELSIPYGWRPGDIKRGDFKMRVKAGVREAFPTAGRYAVTFTRSSFGGVRFNTLELFEGKNSLLLLQKPTISDDGLATTFTFDFYPEYGDMVSSFVVSGQADVAGAASSGAISVSYDQIRPRKSARHDSEE